MLIGKLLMNKYLVIDTEDGEKIYVLTEKNKYTPLERLYKGELLKQIRNYVIENLVKLKNKGGVINVTIDEKNLQK